MRRFERLDATKPSYDATAEHDWISGCYQYANRLAHLEFLRRSGANSTLVFVYFFGDADMSGPQAADEWKSKLSAEYRQLGLQGAMTACGVVNVFLPVTPLNDLE